MKKIGLLALVYLPLVLLNACKKEPDYHYVSKEMTDWLGYKDKSYWIMKDSATNMLDSIVSYGEAASNFSGDKTDQNQIKQFTLGEYQSGGILTGGWNITLMAQKNRNTSILIFSSQSSFSSKIYYAPFISIPFESSGSDHAYRNQEVAINIIPDIIINGQTFTNVYHLHYTFPGKPNEEHIYINQASGLLKIVQDNELSKRTIEIIRSNIVH